MTLPTAVILVKDATEDQKAAVRKGQIPTSALRAYHELYDVSLAPMHWKDIAVDLTGKHIILKGC